MVADLEDRVDADHHRARDQQRAEHVGALRQADALVVGDVAQRQQRGRDADRNVDEEDPVPADGLRQRPAGQQADGRAGRRDEAVDADRLRLLARLREHRHDHAQDHGRRQRAADALREARADQQRLARGEAAQQRREREERKAAQEHAPATDQVAEPPGQQQQPAERDQVGVDDPRQRRLREAEIRLDRRQRDVHDRGVEDDHHEAGAEHDQRGPAPVLLLRGERRAGHFDRACQLADVLGDECRRAPLGADRCLCFGHVEPFLYDGCRTVAKYDDRRTML